MLAHILDRLLLPRESAGVIVATTESTLPHIDSLLAPYEREREVTLLVGDEEDVLSRYVAAVRRYRIDRVIRATADNPLVCIAYIDHAVRLFEKTGADLACFPDLPYGTGVEVVGGDALRDMAKAASLPSEREHVTGHMYGHADRFRIVRGITEPRFSRPDIRLTVDTEEDYRRMSRLYDALYRGSPILLEDVIAHLDRQGGGHG
jgi:spore coat polysaccharide biosynthesis protein SpsF